MHFKAGETTKLPEWRELFAATETAQVGTVLSHADASRALKLAYGSSRYFAQVNRWRREEQAARNRQWRAVHKIGYELLAPSEHPTAAADRLGRAYRESRRAFAVMQHTPMEQLTESQRQKHVNAEARIGVLVQIAAATKKEVRQIYLPAQPPKPALLDK